ncbi:MAG: hypothetical protein J0L61_01315 [Planctomycetes bacterium]|nr:hypothetical protein [Planctomycetota bacterium]
MKHVVAAALLGLPLASASASILYTNQQRSITATASADFGSTVVTQSLSAPDFGPFNEGLEVLAISTTGQHSGLGRADQESTLEPLRIFASGGWSGLRSGGPGGWGGGTSWFSVTFLLEEPSDFTFRVGLVPGGPFMFSGPDGFLIDQEGFHSGTLHPGTYSLTAQASGGASFPASGGGFSLELLLVPAPASVGAVAPLIALTAARRRRA